MSYCVEVWGNVRNCYLISLHRWQKKILRIMTSSGPREPSAALFKALKILSIYQMYVFFVILLVYVYKFKRKYLPSIFNEMFNYNEILPYNFRQSQEFHISFYRLTCRNSFCYTAVKLWNFVNQKIDRNCCIFCYK